MSQQYSEATAMTMAVSYIPYATSSRGKTDNTITFTQFEEENLLSETCDNAESGNEYDENSILPPLISEKGMDAMSSGDESDTKPKSINMLEDIRDGSQ